MLYDGTRSKVERDGKKIMYSDLVKEVDRDGNGETKE